MASTSEDLDRQASGSGRGVPDSVQLRQTVHDFKNLLTLITGHSELLLKRLEAGHPLRRSVEAIRMAAESGTELTRELLETTRRRLPTTVLDVNDIVAGVVQMLGGSLPHTIDIVTRFDPAPGRVRANRAQIEQVIVNLAVNAREAMPDGGRLVFETASVMLEAAPVRRDGELPPGAYVTLSVADTGSGIAPALQERVFERNFTTKKSNGGTGLGLSVVEDIIREHGGRVNVASVLGQGSTFTAYLPRLPDEAWTPGVRLSGERRTGGETVLIVEDEADLLDLMRDILESHRYVVLQAPDAVEALALSRAHGGPIDVVLTDVFLPKPGAQKLVQELRERRPGLRVLYVSGHSEEQIIRAVGPLGEHQLLRKPFAVTSLADKVREVLDRG